MKAHLAFVCQAFASALPWLAIIAAAHPVQAESELEVIYGDDDRRDLHDLENDPTMVDLARSTAVLMDTGTLSPVEGQPNFSRAPSTTFGENFNLCSDEPFREQPNPGFCSGFLVGERLLVTAGHCVESQPRCESTAFVFGFGYETSGDKDVTLIDNADVYHCSRLIAQSLGNGNQTDYAVIELDRPVEGRDPLTFRKEGRIAVGTPLTVIGHPSGLPTKISGGAHVRSTLASAYFVANLDTYGGNSGSAVFNSETYEIEGILVRGEADFITRGSCRTSKVCSNESCRGEDVTRSTEFAPFVDDTALASMPSSPAR